MTEFPGTQEEVGGTDTEAEGTAQARGEGLTFGTRLDHFSELCHASAWDPARSFCADHPNQAEVEGL